MTLFELSKTVRYAYSLKLEKLSLFAIIILFFMLSFLGCGEQAFEATLFQEPQKAPGSIILPAKIDIILAQDDSGSMYESYDEIKKQIPNFLEKLEKSEWDYHFAVTTLTQLRTPALSEILTSKYDANWGTHGRNEWKIPFQGASDQLIHYSVHPNYFRTPDQYHSFVDIGEISTQKGRNENGFETIQNFLDSDSVSESRFRREDAELLIIVLSNGDDTSGVKLCTRSDGWVGPCENAGQPGTQAESFSEYENYFRSIGKSVRFFSGTAFSSQDSCLGGRSIKGNRYQQMSLALQGKSYDICSTPIDKLLSHLENEINKIKLLYRKKFLVLNYEPDLSHPIKVYKKTSEDVNQQNLLITQDPKDGWSYKGLSTEYQIDFPHPMNQVKGYLIELHGKSKLIGEEEAIVEYRPIGAQSSTTEGL